MGHIIATAFSIFIAGIILSEVVSAPIRNRLANGYSARSGAMKFYGGLTCISLPAAILYGFSRLGVNPGMGATLIKSGLAFTLASGLVITVVGFLECHSGERQPAAERP